MCGRSLKKQTISRVGAVGSAVSLRLSNTGLLRRTRLGPTGENGPARPASPCPPRVCLDDASRANRGVLGERGAYPPLTPHAPTPHPPQPPPRRAGEGRAGDNNGRVDPPTPHHHPPHTPPIAQSLGGRVAENRNGVTSTCWGERGKRGGRRPGGEELAAFSPPPPRLGFAPNQWGGGAHGGTEQGFRPASYTENLGGRSPAVPPNPLSIGTERAFIGGFRVHPLRCCVMVRCGQSPTHITQLQRRRVLALYFTSTVWAGNVA